MAGVISRDISGRMRYWMLKTEGFIPLLISLSKKETFRL